MMTLHKEKIVLYIRFILIILLGALSVSLVAQFAGGDGTAEDPWQVETADQFNSLRNYLGAAHSDKHFIQIANISLGNFENWEHIGNSQANSFQGTYNGDGYIITGLRMRRLGSSYVGLFGYINDAVLRNMGLVNVDMEVGCCSGVIVGGQYGEHSLIENCFSTGQLVSSSHRNSGIVGRKGHGTIRNSFSLTTTGSGCCHAGVVGNHDNGMVENSYSAGVQFDYHGTWGPRGLIGSGTAARVTNSYWDSDVTGVANNTNGGQPRTTVQMTQRATFQPGADPNNHWDFGDENQVGIWSILEGISYPVLTSHLENFSPAIAGPSNLAGTPGNQTISLTWNAPGNQPLGYKLYRDGNLVNQDELIVANQYNDTGLTNWQAYNYYVTAVFEIGEEEIESLPSARVTITPVLFAGGAGTENDPFQVNTAQLLDGMRHVLNAHFVLSANINLGEAPWNQGNGWAAIGDQTNRFTGSLNGSGFVISNLTINNTSGYQGLFGYVDGGTLQNIELENVNVRVGNYGGSLAGYLNNTTAFRCSAEGRVQGASSYTGGLVGTIAGGTTSNCWTDVEYSTTSLYGGGLAANVTGTLNNCYTMGNVTSTSTSTNIYIGGLTGTQSGNMDNCYAWGDVMSTADTGTRSYFGGLSGRSSGGVINRSYAAGRVRGGRYVGGLIGNLSGGELNDSYAIGSVEGIEGVGGLIGLNTRPVNRAYSTGSVVGLISVGGLIGRGTGQISNGFWNIQTSGQEESAGGTGLTTVQMTLAGSFQNFDFANIWAIAEGASYPYHLWQEQPGWHNRPGPFNLTATGDIDEMEIDLSWEIIGQPVRYEIYRNNNRVAQVDHNDDQLTWTDTNVAMFTEYAYYVVAVFTVDNEELVSPPSNTRIVILTPPFADGDGSEENPFQVETREHLDMVRYVLNAYFLQIANIDLSDAPWLPIGDNQNHFRGSYDGGEFSISGMMINNTTAYQGLFAYTNGARLTNIALTDVNLRFGQYSGGLAGLINNSIVTGCSVTGRIEGTSTYIGGLTGQINGGTITNCWTDVEITSTGARLGGFAGHTTGTLNGCYAIGNVTGTTTTASAYIGGFAGYFTGTANDCYAMGDVISTNNVNMVGGFAGDSWGTSHRIFATGNVTGGNLVGGLMGYDTNGSLNQSFATGNVTGNEQVGGLLGRSRTIQVNDCYATGNVIGNVNVGGLIGTNTSNTNRSYSVGGVIGNQNVGGLVGENTSNVNQCYWNIQTSGQQESAGGTGLTTAQMVSQQSFAGLNFNNVWSVNEGVTYPYHQWQQTARGHNVPGPHSLTVEGDVDEQEVFLEWQMIGNPARYNIYRNHTRIESVNHPTREYLDEDVPQLQVFVYYVTAIFIDDDENEVETLASNPQLVVLMPDFAGGDGSAGDPYQVANATHLRMVSFDLNAHYLQVADINLNVAPYNEGEGWEPLGSADSNFRGSYNGGEYVIRNAYINRPNSQYQGLFGYIRDAGLSNIELVDVNITGSTYIGGLVGFQYESTITGCSVSGRVTSTLETSSSYTGGLVGYQRYGNAQTNYIRESYSSADVIGGHYTGGLVGDNWDGDIISSGASGEVRGRQYTGGLAGYTRGQVIDCFANGDVRSSSSYVGGLTGYSNNIISGSHATGNVTGVSSYVGGLTARANMAVTNSYATGNVTGASSYVAGLIAYLADNVVVSNSYATGDVFNTSSLTGGLIGDSRGVVNNCFATGNVEGSNDTGGLIGRVISGAVLQVNNCFATGTVTNRSSRAGGLVGYLYSPGVINNSYSTGLVTGVVSNLGGLVGIMQEGANVNNSYWNVETSQRPQSAAGVGRTTAQMLQQATYEEWDFEEQWGIVNGLSYPYQRWMGLQGYSIPGPTALTAEGSDETVDLFWQEPIQDVEPEGYNVYCNGVLVNIDELVTDRTYEVTNLENFREYLFSVTALFDVEGFDELIESSASRVTAIPILPGFAGGEGTNQEPYQIATAGQLFLLREYLGAEHINTFFELTADINLNISPFNTGAGWMIIGSTDAAERFYGNLDGNGFTINGLTINREDTDYVGLFSYLQSAVITGIVFDSIRVTGNQYTGTLCGYAINSQISNCEVRGQIAGTNYTGAFTGYINNVSMSSIHIEADVTGTNYTAGITSYSIGANRINNSSFIGNVNGTNYVGGLIGWQTSGGNAVHESYVAGKINGTGNYVGGIIGYSGSTNTVVNNSYVTAEVMGNEYVGGILGDSRNNVTNVYVTGRVLARNGFEVGPIAGRVAGGTISDNCFWNIETVGYTQTHHNGQGLMTGDMIDADTFGEWDFDEVWAMDEGSYPYLQWQEEAQEFNYPGLIPPHSLSAIAGNARINLAWEEPSTGEPTAYRIYQNDNLVARLDAEETVYLHSPVNNNTVFTYYVTAVYEDEEESQPSNSVRVAAVAGGYAGGSGTADDPYQIASAAQLDNVRFNVTAHYIQTADIDISGYANWNPVGSSASASRFMGSYDGDGFTVNGLRRTGATSNSGLFGYIQFASIRNVTVTGIEMPMSSNSGGLIGYAIDSEVINCSASGTVPQSSSNYIGGLIGFTNNTDVTDSWSDVRILGNGYYVGGLIGYNGGTSRVTNCYALGDIISTYTGTSAYLGGLISYSIGGEVNNVFATGNVISEEENNFVAGLIARNARVLNNAFSRGNVTGGQYVGGLVGYNQNTVTNTYATGRISGGQMDVGGLMGWNNANVTNSYWDTQTTGQAQSAAGDGRTSADMTYQYAANTFVDWDFEELWEDDINRTINNGYPYLYFHPIETLPNPNVAITPQPQNQAVNVPVNLEQVSWMYRSDIVFSDPVGFRVYMDTTGVFTDEHDYVWVPYVENQENYATGDIIPELDYATTYFWKVVPTTNEPDDDRSFNGRRRQSGMDRTVSCPYNSLSRGDAENVPVWRFTTERFPYPATAQNPNPEDGAEDVEVTLQSVRWSYHIDADFTNPVGFRVYMNTTGEFGEDDEFVWVNFAVHQQNYSTGNILPDRLQYGVTYYWKVVPTTENPNRERAESRERRQIATTRNLYGQDTVLSLRGDAVNVPVWSFSTPGIDPNPQAATNPNPEHLATGISLGLPRISWDYLDSEIHTAPVGFRVYMNVTGQFGTNAPYVWVDYDEEETTFSTSEILPLPLDPNTTYYWRVIPTTIHPDDERSDNSRRRYSVRTSERYGPVLRGDAVDVPVWRFTTGTTSLEDEMILPAVTELGRNYPNPFNPVTTISFSLAEDSGVVIEVFNSRGQKIITLFDGYKDAGLHTVIWNGRDSDNREVGSGIYFYRMKSGSYTSTNRMILIK